MTLSNPLDHWLAGGPCPHWCDASRDGCAYQLQGDGTYSRTHRAELVSVAWPALHVELRQAENGTAPDGPTQLEPAGIDFFLSTDLELGSADQAAPRLRQLAAELMNAADRLTETGDHQ